MKAVGTNTRNTPERRRNMFLLLFLSVLFTASCQRNRPEDIALPYAKKKYGTDMWESVQTLTDTAGRPRTFRTGPDRRQIDSGSLLFHAWDDSCRLQPEWQFLSPFLWLQSPSFPHERQNWEEQEFSASRRYLRMLHLSRESEPVLFRYDTLIGLALAESEPFRAESWSESWSETRSDTQSYTRTEIQSRSQTADPANGLLSAEWKHHIISLPNPAEDAACDSILLHLFYRYSAFENGQNPTVLIPYDPHIPELCTPPECFFDKGGILAVVGGTRTEIRRDSSLFFHTADSLYRQIYRDTLHVSLRRRIYREFIDDSLELRKRIKTRTLTIYPQNIGNGIKNAANFLIANMYTTPRKMALLAFGENAPEAQTCLLQRPDLFGAAVICTDTDADLRSVWKALPELSPDSLQLPPTILYAGQSQYALTAFFQEKNRRVCGPAPFLLYKDFDPNEIWKFLLYHTATEENLIKCR